MTLIPLPMVFWTGLPPAIMGVTVSGLAVFPCKCVPGEIELLTWLHGDICCGWGSVLQRKLQLWRSVISMSSSIYNNATFVFNTPVPMSMFILQLALRSELLDAY